MDRFQKPLTKIATIVERARSWAEAEMQDRLIREMQLFARGLKPETQLLFEEGNGSYNFRIVREGKRDLWITSNSVYYSTSGSASFDLGADGASLLSEFLYALREVLFFLDRCNSDYPILWPSCCEVRGSWVRGTKRRRT